jgi:hypothetical protein
VPNIFEDSFDARRNANAVVLTRRFSRRYARKAAAACELAVLIAEAQRRPAQRLIEPPGYGDEDHINT